MLKYHIWTEGCQMNFSDSLRVASTLEGLGYERAARADDADVVILNTCVVRQSAEDKATGYLSSLRPLKKKRPDMVINVMGCMVGVKDTSKLHQRFPYVDVFSPPSDPTPLLKYISEHEHRKLEEDNREKRYTWMDSDFTLPAEHKNLVAGFVPVVYGCSHACTYCIIPYRRGAEISRPPEEIINEVRSLTEQGVKEITLLGQIVDRYGKDRPDYPNLAGLIKQLHEIEGLQRLRFLTSHPNWLTDELIDAVASLPRVMPHFEVPAQAGDDEVLKNMRRGYTNAEYRQTVQRIRERIPGASIATDIIVGFPGESAEQFQKTYELLADLELDVAHLARYSPRPGTVAERHMADDVPDEEKWRRFRLLEDLQEQILTRKHAVYLGETTPVLFEEKVKKRWRGRNPTNKLVFVESESDLRGQLLPVKINWTGPWSFIGELV
ncbi:MAG: tRNA (N6-isopentenyl adenosine(37)-C2)-methylthiotransferase MiaB [Anaerolineae bacterium]|nr:tRNA (N6-isopentenyl adenosine(37)-C2)-methylthiotransferase MiaB [Anaerolineae bacterium]